MALSHSIFNAFLDSKRLRNVPHSKGDIIHEDKIKEISQTLLRSKQAVVHHLIKVRRLESAIASSELFLDFLGRNKQEISFGKKGNIHRIKDLYLSKIDILIGCNKDVAVFLKDFLSSYDDLDLARTLDSFVKNLDSTSVDLDVCTAFMQSIGCISDVEGAKIYASAVRLRTRQKKRFLPWNTIIRMIRRKVLLYRMINELHSARLWVSLENVLLSEKVFNSLSPNSQSMQQKSRVLENTPVALPNIQSHANLKNSLFSSMTRQQAYSEKLAKVIANISHSFTLGKHSQISAIKFSKNVALRKIEIIIKKKYYGYLRIAVMKWKTAITFNSMENICSQFLKYLACTCLLITIQKYLSKKVGEGFKILVLRQDIN